MTQLDLESYLDQAANLERVRGKLEHSVMFFLRTRYTTGAPWFTGPELERYIAQAVPNSTPGSAARILRLLRQQQRVSYHVVNRARSEYAIDEVG